MQGKGSGDGSYLRSRAAGMSFPSLWFFFPVPLPLTFAPWREMLVGSDVSLVWPCLIDKEVDLEMWEFLRGAVGDCGPSYRENWMQTALLFSPPSIILIYGGKLLLEFEKWIFDPKFLSLNHAFNLKREIVS